MSIHDANEIDTNRVIKQEYIYIDVKLKPYNLKHLAWHCHIDVKLKPYNLKHLAWHCQHRILHV